MLKYLFIYAMVTVSDDFFCIFPTLIFFMFPNSFFFLIFIVFFYFTILYWFCHTPWQMHVDVWQKIIFFKRVNSKVNYGLWVIMVCPCRFILVKKCFTLVSDVDNAQGDACVGVGNIW